MPRTRLAVSAVAVLALVSTLAGVGAAAAPNKASLVPLFQSYQAPPGLGDSAGEPTLGINPKTGAVLFQAYTETLRVTGFDKKGKGTATWELGNFPTPQPISLDPILRTDPDTGRTFASQLLLACSQAGFTDDDARTFTLSSGCGPGSAFDHQSVGFGAYVENSPLVKNPVANYPNVVYYCAQDVASAKCSVSNDGGLTFPYTGVAYSTATCELGGIFGHLKDAPDGTVYLPPRSCGDTVNNTEITGVSVSQDNGLTWTLRKAPNTITGDAGHPSVGVGTTGDVYLAYGGPRDGKTVGQSGPPMMVLSKDKGQTWTAPVNVGKDKAITNTRFPLAVAGAPGQAAVAYLGSTTGGDGSAKEFAGRWDLYVSYTKDFGKTWRTTKATSDPVQVGSVCTGGTTCGNDRNLLDFNDMVLDPKTGRVVIAIADGCPQADDCDTRIRRQKATIVRQVGGPSLLAPVKR